MPVLKELGERCLFRGYRFIRTVDFGSSANRHIGSRNHRYW